jgi:pimeloyl-ACP methyl ester carboxylesterase
MNDRERTFTFPVGYHRFHRKQLFNYQLNRWHSFGYARFEDMEEAGRRVEDFDDWKRVMVELAERAEREDRLVNAAFYYRAAEFYTFRDDPDKGSLYDRFAGLFYRVFGDEGMERFDVPYGDAFLPALMLPAAGAEGGAPRGYGEVVGTDGADGGEPAGGASASVGMEGPGVRNKGTIVMHGGFDSYIEEFYSWMRYFSDRGYDVVAFEGPGQGAARKKHGLALDHRWEGPAKAILDHFGLKDVTWLGVSMGGYLCFRAAAFEPRIARVIASGIAYDYMQFPPKIFQWMMFLFFDHLRNFSNRATLKKMRKDGMHRWTIENLMYISDTGTPMDAFDVARRMNAENLHSEGVTQDVLILTGRNDHFIPFKMHRMQVEALTNARSVTARVFTRETQAHNHCQNGNFGLALRVMADWIEEKS